MKVSPSIVQNELIGLDIEVVKSPNSNLIGIAGRVVNETRNTFTIFQENKEKMIIKEDAIFNFCLQNGTIIEIDGKILIGRPEDRIKKRPRRLW